MEYVAGIETAHRRDDRIAIQRVDRLPDLAMIRIPGRPRIEIENLISCPHVVLDQVGPDETRTTGDEDAPRHGATLAGRTPCPGENLIGCARSGLCWVGRGARGVESAAGH